MSRIDSNRANMIGVLASQDSWYCRDLVRVSEAEFGPRLKVMPLGFQDLSTAFLGGDSVVTRFRVDDGEPQRIELDWLIVRTMPLGSLEQIVFRMNALQAASDSGIRVINAPRCLEICIDKWLTLAMAHRAGIEIPRTISCQTRQDAMIAWHELGEDCVVKPLFGGEGRGIMRVSDPDMAWRVFSTLEQLRAVAYIQEFIESDGFDLRLLVVGDKIFCVKRSNDSDWRSNVSRGGRAVAHEPTFEQISMAFRAAKAVNGWMVGVDILPTRDGRNVLLEVNAVPGWRATAAALQVDIASVVLNQLMKTEGF